VCARLFYEGGSKLKLYHIKRFPAFVRRLAVPVTELRTKIRKAFFRLSAGLTCALMTSTTAFAADKDSNLPGDVLEEGSDIWAWLKYALGDIYNKFLSVSTIAACVAASVCLILMNFSTDDRTVASSRAWLKRILISWIILNVLGYIVIYLTAITQGGVYTPPIE